MKALVIDDTKICLQRTAEVLQKEGWDIKTVYVTPENRENFRITELAQQIPVDLRGINLVVCDLEFGGNVNSFGLVCAIRKQYPEIPVVLLTGEWLEESKELATVGIYHFHKGKWFNMQIFPKAGKRVLKDLAEDWWKDTLEIPINNPIIPPDDPAWIPQAYGKPGIPATDPRLKEKLPPLWSDLKAINAGDIEKIFELVKPWVKRTRDGRRQEQLESLRIIMGLVDNEIVPYKNYYYSTLEPDKLSHCIGHALCDGALSSEDVAPFLSGLQKIVPKMLKSPYATDETKVRFKLCTEFIKSGRPAEDLPMIFGTY